MRGAGGAARLIWGQRQLHYFMENLLGLCASGKINVTSLKMKQFISKRKGIQGEGFNEKVYDFFCNVSGAVVRKKVKKVGKLKILFKGQDLGDLDVLVVLPKKHKILVVENKNISLAKTPYETNSEIMDIFLGDKAIIMKHSKRLEWVKKHYEDVLQWLKIDAKGRWDIQGVIVIDKQLMSPYFAKASMSVISFRELSQDWCSQWINS